MTMVGAVGVSASLLRILQRTKHRCYHDRSMQQKSLLHTCNKIISYRNVSLDVFSLCHPPSHRV